MNRLCPDAPVPVLDETAPRRPARAAPAWRRCSPPAQGVEVVLVTALADDAGGARLSGLLAAAGVQVYALPLRRRHPGEDPAAGRRPGAAAPRPGRRGGGAGRARRRRCSGAARRRRRRSWSATTGGAWPGSRRCGRRWPPPPRPGGLGPAPARPGGGARACGWPRRTRRRCGTWPGAAAARPRLAAAARGAQALRQRWRAGAVAVTLGGDGALLCHAGSTPLVVPAPRARRRGHLRRRRPVRRRRPALALAAGRWSPRRCRRRSPRRRAYVADGGAAAALAARPIARRPPELGRRGRSPDRAWVRRAGRARCVVRGSGRAGGTVVATGGCFDLLHAGHVATLAGRPQLGDCLVVCLNSDASVTAAEGAGPAGDAAGRPGPAAGRAGLRRRGGHLRRADPGRRCCPGCAPTSGSRAATTAPAAARPDLPEAELLRRWGGQTVVVPYLDGRSTTALIAAARTGARAARKEHR